MSYINNSKDEDYSKQTNNERSPGVSCFTTSMINASLAVCTIYPKVESKYSQLEDKYDEFIYSPEMEDWYTNKAHPDVRKMISLGIEPREIWAVQEYCFNKWVGYDACKITWRLTKEALISHLLNGGTVVMGGKFCGFGHMVSVCGFRSNLEKSADVNAVTHIVIDDSYGNPNNNYQPRGVGGNNVEIPFAEFWSKIKGDGDTRYAVLFEKNKYKLSPLYVENAGTGVAIPSVGAPATEAVKKMILKIQEFFNPPRMSFCFA